MSRQPRQPIRLTPLGEYVFGFLSLGALTLTLVLGPVAFLDLVAR